MVITGDDEKHTNTHAQRDRLTDSLYHAPQRTNCQIKVALTNYIEKCDRGDIALAIERALQCNVLLRSIGELVWVANYRVLQDVLQVALF